ncbi:ATP-dependent DNA helicase RecQ [Planctopirus limnophila DSM 3776]|uniref:DNA helicase RecQ n=2 Tax=Planctopirus limnophila TaxID=120 RepID=D5SUL1_PLAL2|nr:ATP-dependent DNA helicase RecQ [Planctopirus limnophila DSM 3776]
MHGLQPLSSAFREESLVSMVDVTDLADCEITREKLDQASSSQFVAQGSCLNEARLLLQRLWGYEDFRPLQEQVIQALLAGRESVVVLPTGGGKSLCYQVPALLKPGLAIVVSPLISLMFDQVSSLQEVGVAAAAIHSGLSNQERQQIAGQIRSGELRLLYLSPERLMTDRMLGFLEQVPLSMLAIDEAHCISDWGHDFRPEYRMLSGLKDRFPQLPIHAFTATATQEVRQDIARQLGLANPQFHVGSFDRPNLIYRVIPREDRDQQVISTIRRHPGESGVVYCLRRKDVDDVTTMLKQAGFRALPYHAGLPDEERHANQHAFLNDHVEIIVATVAFGMGIDKSDVRFVIHTGAPKSLEAYQQESGRAGRDGLDAECWLFYAQGDFALWRSLQANLPEKAQQTAQQVLAGMEGFCQSTKCRHRAIIEYFGQAGESGECGACDICLGELTEVEDSLVVSQMILSCVVRVEQSFGADHVCKVLVGSRAKNILNRGHDQLSTFGLLKGVDLKVLRHWIEQLISQSFLERYGEYGLLRVTPAGRLVLKGVQSPQLLVANSTSFRQTGVAQVAWAGVDRELFEELRDLRRQLATERGVPPFIIFGDAPLREMAAVRPLSTISFRQIRGIGDKKTSLYGEVFVAVISRYCHERNLAGDQFAVREQSQNSPPATVDQSPPIKREPGEIQKRAYELFSSGQELEAVAKVLERSRSTVAQYLEEYILDRGLQDGLPWVEKSEFSQIEGAFEAEDHRRLKPAFDRLNGQVTYEKLRVVRACLQNRGHWPK